jgi:phosphoribosylaminoimidazolecarboxamide formyltransferase/IMP cyclohydrolase
LAAKEHFFEVIVAPEFSHGALRLLEARWANVRLLRVGDVSHQPARTNKHHGLEFKSMPGGVLVQEQDTCFTKESDLKLMAGPAPSRDQLTCARFLECVGRSLLSNAIVVGGPGEAAGSLHMYGAGAGQMDRVTSCRIAVEKAGDLARGAVAYSDAFFPFADGPEVLVRAGVKVIVHPGGSKRDEDTFSLCARAGVTCLTTGTRHFRH